MQVSPCTLIQPLSGPRSPATRLNLELHAVCEEHSSIPLRLAVSLACRWAGRGIQLESGSTSVVCRAVTLDDQDD